MIASRKKRATGIIVISLIALAAIAFLSLHMWIGISVRQNIALAEKKYPGTPEEALISYLQDDTNTFRDRTHIAIWTLGQIRSARALPILEGYYQNDPKGGTCYGRHDSVLCQYELHKAIVKIKKGWILSYAYLK